MSQKLESTQSATGDTQIISKISKASTEATRSVDHGRNPRDRRTVSTQNTSEADTKSKPEPNTFQIANQGGDELKWLTQQRTSEEQAVGTTSEDNNYLVKTDKQNPINPPKPERYAAPITKTSSSDGSSDTNTKKKSASTDSGGHVIIDMPDSHFKNGFQFPANRIRFIQRVFTLLAFMLTFVAVACSFALFSENFRKFAKDYYWIQFVAGILFTVLYLLVICIKPLRRKSPWNGIFLTLITLVAAVMTSFICAVNSVEAVGLAAILTLSCCFGLAVFAICVKKDFTVYYFAFFIVCIIFLVATLLLGVIFMFYKNDFAHWCTSLGISIVAAGLLMFSLVMNLQYIFGGRKYQLDIDEYVAGALILFVDIIYLFITILQIIRLAK